MLTSQQKSLRHAVLRNYHEYNRILSAAVEKIPLAVSTHCNAIYDERTAHQVLIHAACLHRSPASYARSQRNKNKLAPTPEWMRQVVRNTCEGSPEKMLIDIAKENIAELRRQNRLPAKVIIGIDKTKKPRYDKDNSDLTPSKPKDGTSNFETYATAQILNEGARMALCSILIKKDDKNVDIVRKLVCYCEEFGLEIEAFLLDREFFSAAIFRVFNETGHRYLIPCRGTSVVNKAIHEYEIGIRNMVSTCIVSKGKNEEQYYIILVPNKRKPEEYQAFATNDPNINTKKYSKRWDIENGFKYTKNMKLKTHSRSADCRMFLFIYTQMLLNLWTIFNVILLLRDKVGKLPQDDYLDLLESLIGEIPPEPPPPEPPEPIAP